VDVKDALKFGVAAEGLSINNQNQLLAIERRTELTADDTIFLRINQMKQRNYQLEFVPDNLNANLQAFLIDSFTRSSTPISLMDTTRVLFTVNSTPESYAPNRFMVVFKISRALPVHFIAVNAKKTSSSSINISWDVDNEYNINKYIIEHSANGLSFDSLSETLPKGNNISKEHYEIFDSKSSTLVNNFYRIKAINQDQSYCYSPITNLSATINQNQIEVLPNPVVNGVANIKLNHFNVGKYSLALYNLLGEVIYTGSVIITSENESKTVIISKIPKGIYTLQITDEFNNRKTQKICSQ
jgi:hypothetical protein